MKQIRHYFPFIFVALTFVFVQPGLAQKGALQINHTVSLGDVAKQEFHIATEIRNIDQPQLDLSLPTWAPGWYTVENYFKNVLRFRITDGSGKILPLRMSRKQTWNVDTRWQGFRDADEGRLSRVYGFHLDRKGSATTQQLKIRDGWLKR